MIQHFFVLLLLSACQATLFAEGGGGGGGASNIISKEISSMDESIELRRVPLQQKQRSTNDSRLLKRHNNDGNNNKKNNDNNNDDQDSSTAILETHDEHITPGDGFGGGVPSIEELQYEYDQVVPVVMQQYASLSDLASELKNNKKEGIVNDNEIVAGIKNNNNGTNNKDGSSKSGKNEDMNMMSMDHNVRSTESKQYKVHASKSRKVSTGVCNKRLQSAYNATQEADQAAFPQIDNADDITALCAFRPNADANFGCAGFYYDPNLEPYFFKGVIDTTTAIGEDPAVVAYALINLYCDCYYGYDLGCINDLPSTPQEREEYCIFAGVWNGDFDSMMSSGIGTDSGKSGKGGGGLSQEMLNCGCFWIGQEKEKVGNCPGVDLGYFYKPPGDGNAVSAFLD